MGLFNVMAKADGGNVDTTQLAASTGADALFIREFLMLLQIERL